MKSIIEKNWDLNCYTSQLIKIYTESNWAHFQIYSQGVYKILSKWNKNAAMFNQFLVDLRWIWDVKVNPSWIENLWKMKTENLLIFRSHLRSDFYLFWEDWRAKLAPSRPCQISWGPPLKGLGASWRQDGLQTPPRVSQGQFLSIFW